MRVRADEGVDLANLLVGQTRVGLGDRHELAHVPDAERVVGVEPGPLAVAGLRVHEHGVDRVRLRLSTSTTARAAGRRRTARRAA